MDAITVDGLTMTYRVPIREPGLRAALRSIGRRSRRDIAAVADASFSVRPGELVGFIGPNGAGKTTTMKILSGLLRPTAGRIDVLGQTPWDRRTAFLKRIAFVRGSQPVGGSQELTVLDTLDYQRLLYQVDRAEFAATLAELTTLLDLEPLLQRQLRALSLGERMRVGLALSLSYRPEVLFLDEPTLGLDVSAAAAIRTFVRDQVARTGATVLLTSHYMADVEELCPRLILIDQGTVRYDGPLGQLSARLSPYKLIRFAAPEAGAEQFSGLGEVVQEDGDDRWLLRVPRAEVATTTARVLSTIRVTDLAVEDPPLEQVIDRAYREGIG
ncbi:ABC transporter ATP-binding protein [Microlunatus speluncae]|uniref:ABC transporter ATP-binding protein n=1 Tax=Microlunatus speluncae TaxID=2594267 RepID=UPI001FEC8F9E|nr:ATP-binding cassette domain-containing protein [Microlunatus speluncae]